MRWHQVMARLAAILTMALALALPGQVDATAQTPVTIGTAPTTTTTLVSTPAPPAQQNEIDDLRRRVNNLQEIVQLVLGPIAILIGVLALGGVLGVVFSLRDQRRLSQLHELAVGSEVSSQRRTELSYSSFLEESQKTLTLVNETLALAREATDRAAHTMEQKAESNLASIESNARDLLEPILELKEFDKIADDPDARSRLQTIAQELSSIEGYLLLQDIELQPHSRYVKGMAQYFNDDTAAALRTLRYAAQDSSFRELQLFATYWVAYLNIALGRYPQAINVFDLGGDSIRKGTLENTEFTRMRDDSKFFKLAADNLDANPLTRFHLVAPLLIELEELSDKLKADPTQAESRTSREVADTRGDLLSWIAHRDDYLHQPLPSDAVTCARSLRLDPTAAVPDDEPPPQPIEAVQKGLLLERDDPYPDDVIRAWALLEAQAIYNREHSRDLLIAFGKAEFDYMLGRAASKLVDSYRAVEQKVTEELAVHREQRKSVELDRKYSVIPWEGMPRTRPVVMAGCLDRLGFVPGSRLR